MIVLLFLIKCCACACAVVVLLGEAVLEYKVCSETLTQFSSTCQQPRVSTIFSFNRIVRNPPMSKLHTI
jgi:hypothetical protein